MAPLSDGSKTVKSQTLEAGDSSPGDGSAEATRIDGKRLNMATSVDFAALSAVLAGDPLSPRYEARRLLGQGGYGSVYAAYDRDLRREVALKVVRPPEGVERELFIREARVTAGLVHPNIPTVYDVAERDGTFYLSIEQVSGQSLGALIRAAALRGDTEVMPQVQLVEVMLKVADAVEYAHAQGVIHRDIKPDNIVIGGYGKVALIDWGAAHSTQNPVPTKGLVIGTPTYMAPEQLEAGPPAAASDIYGFGATLFHALLLRAPIARSESEVFWQRKARGSIDPPTPAELARVPRALLGIAVRAMSADPRNRYADMRVLGQALRDVLVGRKAWLAPSNVALEDDAFRDRWAEVPEGAFERQGTNLLSRGPEACFLFYKQRLAAGVALEFEGEILPGERPGDLSVVWTEDDILEPAPHPPERGTICLQIGAYDNLTAGIYRDFGQCLQGRSLSIDIGRTYQIRAEVDEHMLRLFLDGELIAEYDQLFPTPSGYVGLFSHAPGKRISNIRLFERSLPEHVSPTAIGDAFFARKQYAEAAQQYARVEERLPGTELAEEARFKRGLTLASEGQTAQAAELWSLLRTDTWRIRARLHLIDATFEARQHQSVVDALRELLSKSPSARSLVIDRWVQYVNALCLSDAAPLPHYRDLREQHFSDDPGSASSAAGLELALGNFHVVVERFANQPPQHFEALCCLGEFEKAGESYRGIPWMSELSETYLNRFDQLQNDTLRALALALRGEIEASLATGTCVEALLSAGLYDDVLSYRWVKPADVGAALRAQGRIEEATARGDARALCQIDAGPEVLASPLVLEERLYLLQHFAIKAFASGDVASYLAYRDAAAATPCAANVEDIWLARHFLIPILERELGDSMACERAARHVIAEFPRHWRAKAHHLARYLVGDISLTQFEAQPVRLCMRGRAILARALRLEYLLERRAAGAAYREFLELPSRERYSDSTRGDPLVDRWAALRAEF